ncbi:MAG: FAD-dependent oxidoreductase [Chitinophagaceae bacterium]|nr:FAD-dependent oxidoreductase [Chitinophagaceae bacterium]
MFLPFESKWRNCFYTWEGLSRIPGFLGHGNTRLTIHKNMKGKVRTIIIIGAGPAGLMAAKKLSKKYKVIILEARDRIGGRIQSVMEPGFSTLVESGAEFIHGKLPQTFRLLKKAGIGYEKMQGQMYRVGPDGWQIQKEMIPGWYKLLKQMKKEKRDRTLSDFLEEYYPGEPHRAFRLQVRSYAEGFDLADTSKVSIHALRKEWSAEEEEIYRITGGYGQLIRYLEEECHKHGCDIYTDNCVQQIDWEKEDVTVYSTSGKKFSGEKCIITVPLNIFAKVIGPGAINITPPLDEQVTAAKEVGFGTAIKIAFEFNEPFWKGYAENPGFIISDEPVPVWWVGNSKAPRLLTGWKGGPGAALLSKCTDDEILQTALQSLSVIFRIPIIALREKLVASKIFNWLKQDYSEGAYSHDYPTSEKAKNLLNTSVADTIFFAGEGIFQGASAGTVEAALASGKQTASKLMK